MVGGTHATKLVALGHEMRMGARTANDGKAVEWAAANSTSAGQGAFADVASWAAPIALCPPAAARGTEGMMPFWLRV